MANAALAANSTDAAVEMLRLTLLALIRLVYRQARGFNREFPALSRFRPAIFFSQIDYDEHCLFNEQFGDQIAAMWDQIGKHPLCQTLFAHHDQVMSRRRIWVGIDVF